MPKINSIKNKSVDGCGMYSRNKLTHLWAIVFKSSKPFNSEGIVFSTNAAVTIYQ